MILQTGSAIPSTAVELVVNATLPAQIVLAILAFLSLLSWAVMFAKWLEFRRLATRTAAFMVEFGRVSKLDEAAALAKRLEPGPHTRVIARATQFLKEIRPLALDGGEVRTRMNAAQVEAFHFVLNAEFTAERDRLGAYVPTLAIIGSASPLLGLLGTVLGVIDAFLGIAREGSGNLSAVAPGVAEALVATAAALAVAVPAVFAYNIFAARLNRFDGQLDGFGAELIALLARDGKI
ncbi:MAG: MotA/TolQ/ExbB proton channel family protein [Gemmatimonadetes bacterium]|nr:MotA/TolQ/ExbB proton channel family protein [Gemmatimonadota bacterium]